MMLCLATTSLQKKKKKKLFYSCIPLNQVFLNSQLQICSVLHAHRWVGHLWYARFWPLKGLGISNIINNGEGNGTPLQYSCLENPMDGGAWKAAVHGVAKSRTRLSDFTFTFPFHALEKEMATHSSALAWRISGTGELPSLGSHRVGHDWSDLAAAI